ncbi:hypothetical protein PCASD_14639 [Puccinia coronata f. sp. avenae]|uniref:Uncharacterized protein n=1 Tax=Puccinia coronata f. sp. avenae TaxID=200324 RepID=A0A2N5U432_9BASI|nr:hypothetical protein PCASD_14639 [Puccinia coronata f. sp. avenae]
MPLLLYIRTGEEPPGKLGPVQLVGRASRQAGYCPASLGEPPDQLAQHQLIRRAPNQLKLHQLIRRASQSAGTTSARRESLPTSWQCITAREPPDQLAMYQLGERASRSRWPSSTELNTSLATLSHRVEHLAGQAWPTS